MKKFHLSLIKCVVVQFKRELITRYSYTRIGNVFYHDSTSFTKTTLIYKSDEGKAFKIRRNYDYGFYITEGDKMICFSIKEGNKQLPLRYNYFPAKDRYISPHQKYAYQLAYRALNLRGSIIAVIAACLFLFGGLVYGFTSWSTSISENNISFHDIFFTNNYPLNTLGLSLVLLVFSLHTACVVRTLKIKKKFTELLDNYFLQELKNENSI